MGMSESLPHFIGRSYMDLQTLRAQAERLGFWDDVKVFDAVLAEKRRTDHADGSQPNG